MILSSGRWSGRGWFRYCQKNHFDQRNALMIDYHNLTQLNDVGNFGLTDTPGHSFSESGKLTRR